ncbi:MAG: nuclear transport factor 2 family protein [Steroidobacteraceae bacterium]|nr:nuclear transport factor 2 family protein [Steroidobacteraceae bacterium]
MFSRMMKTAVSVLALCAVAGSVYAAEWTAEQQEIWKFEQQQWQMSESKDLSWIDTMVHQNMRYWGTGSPMPRDKASLKHWSRYDSESSTTLQYELFPISATITGNIAVVQYHYMVASENYKKERETVTGHYTDVLIKENGRWMFIAWSGGEDKKD